MHDGVTVAVRTAAAVAADGVDGGCDGGGVVAAAEHADRTMVAAVGRAIVAAAVPFRWCRYRAELSRLEDRLECGDVAFRMAYRDLCSHGCCCCCCCC